MGHGYGKKNSIGNRSCKTGKCITIDGIQGFYTRCKCIGKNKEKSNEGCRRVKVPAKCFGSRLDH